MNDLLDFIKNPKDREDFFIAVIVIILFGAGIIYSIFPRNNYDGSLTEQELADNLNQSLVDGTLKSKIFTDLEASDEIVDVDSKERQGSNKAAIEEKDRMVLTNVKPIKDSPVIINKDQLEDRTADTELYDKKQKEKEDLKAAATAAAIEKANRLEAEKTAKNSEKETTTNAASKVAELKAAEELKIGEAKKAEDLKAAEELKIGEAKKAEDLKAAEELKIGEAKKAEEAADASKNRPINQSPTTNDDKKETATAEYDKTKPKKKSSSPKVKPSGPRADCVVVLGAFKNPSGVEAILKKLKDANYKTTTGYIKGLRYVGVPIYCNKNNDKVIKDLNDRFDKEAWVLKR